MTRVALRGLLGRRVRALLTAFAVVLGVAMVSGTLILTDTIQKAFDSVFDESLAGTSVVVSGKEIVEGSPNAEATVPAALLPRVRALPGVAAASGGFLFADDVKLLDRDGDPVGGSGATPLAFGVDPAQPRFNPLTLTSGAWASGPGEVVIDERTASKSHYSIGERIQVQADGPIEGYAITGIAKLGDVSLGNATLAAFDVPTAQALLNERGRFQVISVAAEDGVSDQRLAARIRPLLPASAEVQTSDEEAAEAGGEVSDAIGIIRSILLAFGGIALFVGAFVIFNTISITVAQRVREFATLRTLGASRRQVLRSVLIESLALGLLASVVGLALGLGLARGLNALFVAFGLDLPKAGTVFALRTVVVALAVGTLVTVLAAIVPALKATRVAPIAAVREGAVLPRSRHPRRRPVAAACLVALALALIAQGLFAGAGAKGVLVPLGAGTLLLFIGVAIVSSTLVRPLAALVGLPARRLGGAAGRLAAENSVRNPGRTAATAAALMIGLALITFVATLGAGLRLSVVDALERQVVANYVVSTSTDADKPLFPAAAGDRVAAAPGVTVASSVRSDKARSFGETVDVAGVDGATIGDVYRFDWAQGSDGVPAALGASGAIVDDELAEDHDLAVGDRIAITTPAGGRARFIVRGIAEPPKMDPLLTGIVIGQAAFDERFPSPANAFTFVNTAGGATAATTARLERSLNRFPDARLQTRAAWMDERAGDVDKTLALFYVLLALSVIVSLFGMVNTLILSVFERTRELGMLRAIGMTRRQARRMVRHESVITALIGAALGLPLGVFLAALVTRGMAEEGVGFHVPATALAGFAVLAVLAGVLAAVLPARRASRLDVLRALQYE